MIKIELSKIPSQPGVYIFKDKNQRPLYIGKAKNLRKRIAFYLRSDSLKLKELLEVAEYLEIIETKNEAEAIFKESDLIKRFNPPFNQLLRDDTNYFYIIFTKHQFPKIIITHQPHNFNFYKIFGPFSEGSSLRQFLKIIRSKLPFCNCLESHFRECLNYQLGLCYGYCCTRNFKVTEKEKTEYYKNLEMIEKILNGNFTQLKSEILEKMESLIKKDQIYEAQKLQNVYLAIKKIEEEVQILKPDSFYIENTRRKVLLELKGKLNLIEFPKIIEVYDISHLFGNFRVGISVSFFDGFYNPQKLRKFKIKTVLKPDDARMIYEVLKRRFSHDEWELPNLILIDGGKIQFKYAKQALEEKDLDKKIGLISFAKPSRKIFYDLNKKPINLEEFSLPTQNFIKLIDLKAHQIVLKYHRKLREK